MTLWKDTKRNNTQKLIDWLLSAKTGTVWPADRVNMVAFSELGSSSSRSDLTQNVIIQILKEMSKSNKTSVDDFEAIFEQIRKTGAIDAHNHAARWKFFIPIEINLNSDITQRLKIRILGNDFFFVSITSVERQLDKETRQGLRDPNVILINTGIKVDHIPKIFISISSEAPSWNLAWKEVEPAFDALRGLLELSLDFYEWRFTNNGKSARGRIPHPLWMIACKKGEPPEWVYFITEEASISEPFELTNAHLTKIKKNAKVLRTEPKPQSTLSLIADSLRLYTQAMDAHFKHLCFLGFWQLAEAITQSEAVGGSIDKVAARIAWHGSRIGLKGSGYTETLAVLGRKRNDIVHRGIHEVEDIDINILKLACEAAFAWLFQVHKSLPTVAHINQYYRLRETNQTDLEAIEGCVAYIKKQKSK